MTEWQEKDDIIKIRCSNCKKKYTLTDYEFEITFGYKEHDVPYKTCNKCRGKNKTKITCDRCGMNVIEGEITMHRMTEHCCRTHYKKQKVICEFCSHLEEVSCKRCEAWLYNRPDNVIALDKYIKENELGEMYIKSDLKTKLKNIEYRKKYKDVPDEEIPINTSCPFYTINVEDDELNDYYELV